MNDGTSWGDAFVTLQDALQMLADCESPGQVWIARGTYYPDEGQNGSNNNRNRSFTMPHDVQIYGGFIGNETLLSQRNWENHLTILSGDIDQNDHLGSIQYNSFNVINNDYSAANPLTGTARLDGVIVTGGNASQEFLNDEGGGMRNVNSSPSILNCTFSTNYASYGAGMHNDSSHITLVNCNFLRDTASIDGGGIRHLRGNLTLIDCGFDTNEAGTIIGAEGGGGLSYNPLQHSLIMNNCHFLNNTTTGRGGAILIKSGGALINISECSFTSNLGRFSGAVSTYSRTNVTACTFTSNQVKSGSDVDDQYNGGAIEIAADSTSIENCSFDGNKTDQYGGAVAVNFFGIVNVMNSTFIQNQADYFTFFNPDFVEPRGGAAYVNIDAKAKFVNCDFEENYADRRGGAIHSQSDEAEFVNCRFWNNHANEAHSIYNNDANTKIINCVFANNNVGDPAPIISNENNSNPIIKNCSLWKFDSPNPGAIIVDDAGSTSDVSYCIVQGGWANGTSIIDEDPKFYDISTGDLTLQNCSPAIDNGGNSGNEFNFDLLSNPRLHNATGAQKARIDIGPYEFQDDYTPSCCIEDLVLSGLIDGGTYEASISITCDGIIEAGSEVIFNAPVINLSEEFEIEDMGTLETQTAGCGNN